MDETRLGQALGRAPIVLVTGPRQAGKTTLVDLLLGKVGDDLEVHRLDAEDPRDRARLDDPMLALEPLRGVVMIDEAQHVADLFPVLRVLADRPGRPARFVVLGSASPDLIGMTAESLAGRVELIELGGLRLADVGAEESGRWWRRGGLPPSFLAENETDSVAWRDNYIATFLERDLGQLGVRVPATTMRRTWTMLAHYHGQTWNGAELARALGIGQSTVRRYLDALTDALVVRQLQPWLANISKRQVRSPKIYLRDAGLLHRLLGVNDADGLESHPKVGASFEGLVVEELARIVSPAPLYFWRTQHGAELDVYTEIDGRRIGVEVKRTTAPRVTPSIRHAIADLDLDHVVVAHAGRDTFPLAERVTAVPAPQLVVASGPDELFDRIER